MASPLKGRKLSKSHKRNISLGKQRFETEKKRLAKRAMTASARTKSSRTSSTGRTSRSRG